MANAMQADEAFCVRCKKRIKIADLEHVTMRNGRPARRGKCPECQTGVYRILPKELPDG